MVEINCKVGGAQPWQLLRAQSELQWKVGQGKFKHRSNIIRRSAQKINQDGNQMC